jgi:hypothetical protein
VNKKGIAAWSARNVNIDVREAYGFAGEAVYFWGVSANCKNIVFEGIFSHDHKFNALNFNVIGPEENLVIRDCYTLNSYSGIEMSSGEASGNTIINPASNAIWTGVGGGGKTKINRNIIKNAGVAAIYVGWASLMNRGVEVCDNDIEGAGTFGLLCTFTRGLKITGNKIRGWGATGAGWALQVSDSDYGVVGGNEAVFPGGSSSGAFFTAFNTTNLTTYNNTTTPTATTPNQSQQYSEGSFVPAPTALTVVGAANYSGKYTQIGNIINWAITIVPVGAGTTASTLSSTSFSGLPAAASPNGVCVAASTAIGSYGTGLVTGSAAYPPSWTATNATVTISGTYFA